jgi:hypothetical protein
VAVEASARFGSLEASADCAPVCCTILQAEHRDVQYSSCAEELSGYPSRCCTASYRWTQRVSTAAGSGVLVSSWLWPAQQLLYKVAAVDQAGFTQPSWQGPGTAQQLHASYVNFAVGCSCHAVYLMCCVPLSKCLSTDPQCPAAALANLQDGCQRDSRWCLSTRMAREHTAQLPGCSR